MADSIKSVDVPSVHGMVALNPDGTAIGTPVGGATSANQTNGSQKTQIVTSGGTTVDTFGGGTQYTEGDTDATITGTAMMWEDTSNTLRAVSSTKPLPVSATIDTTGLATNATDTSVASIDSKTPALGQALAAASVPVVLTAAQLTTLTPPAAITGFATSAKQDTIIGHVDGIETSLSSIDGKITAVNTGAVVVSSSALPSGASTAAKQPALGTAGTASADVITVQGIASMTALKVDGSAVTQPVSGTVAVTNAGTFATQVNGAALTALQLIDDSNGIPSGTVLNASTAPVTVMGMRNSAGNAFYATGASDNADNLAVNANGNDLRTVSLGFVFDGTTWDRVPGNSTDGLLVNLGTNNDVSLNAGTNAIGKLAANSGVDIGDVDVTSVSGTVTTKGIPSDIDINGSNANHVDKYYTNAGAVTDGIIWSPAAGKRWHVLTLYINVSAAATVTLEDDLAGGDVARWKGELAANSGVVLKYDKEHPFCSGEDAADLIITTSAGNVYVQAVGYEV